MSCAAVLQKYDAERDEAQCQRIAAAAWGVAPKNASQHKQPPPSNGRKQTMTQQDIMRNYGK